jgi:hypothetical protein
MYCSQVCFICNDTYLFYAFKRCRQCVFECCRNCYLKLENRRCPYCRYEPDLFLDFVEETRYGILFIVIPFLLLFYFMMILLFVVISQIQFNRSIIKIN